MIKSLLTTAATVILSASVAFAAPEIGKVAPNFTTKDTNGKEITLSALKGKTVVLEWTNPGCPFVKKFYSGGDIQKLQAAYTAKDVTWIRINSSAEGKEGHQTADSANTLAKEQKASATHTVLDADGKIGHLYEAKTTPHMFVVNKEGNLAYMGAIDSIRTADSADIAKAENYVVSALDSLLAGQEVKIPTTQPYGCGVKY